MENTDIKVLIIEDSNADLRLMREFLAEAAGRGYRFDVTGAETLSLALKLLETTPYHIILADLFLPDSSGLDTFTAICGRAPDTPVVPLTSFEDESVAVEAMRLGAQDYLVKKTVNGEVLSRAITYSMERKRIEANLRASEERYHTLIDALDDAIVVLDPEFRVIMSNGSFKRASRAGGSCPPETGGASADGISVLPVKTPELCKRALSEEKIITSEHPCPWNGRQSFLEIKCVPVLAGGKGPRVVVVAKDITERKRVEQLKDNFASLVSHELRTPLTAILAGLAIVLESTAGHLDEVEKKLLCISYQDAQRLDRIITKLLEMSRLEAGTSRFKKSVADVARLADEAIARFSPRAKSRNIELRGRYSAAKIETLLDIDGITEVFTNLLSNALKFTEKGYIEIGVSEKGDLIECYVKDSGVGISKENQPKLFSKFKQFGTPVAEEEKGTGLGLFIVKEILRRHNGTLAVFSEPGKGSTFSFTLPKRREEKTAETPPQRAR